jgi:hypothetical protein
VHFENKVEFSLLATYNQYQKHLRLCAYHWMSNNIKGTQNFLTLIQPDFFAMSLLNISNWHLTDLTRCGIQTGKIGQLKLWRTILMLCPMVLQLDATCIYLYKIALLSDQKQCK